VSSAMCKACHVLEDAVEFATSTFGSTAEEQSRDYSQPRDLKPDLSRSWSPLHSMANPEDHAKGGGQEVWGL